MTRTAYNATRRHRRRTGRTCSPCGTLIEHLHANRRRCDSCERELRNERMRRWRAGNLGHVRAYDRARQPRRNQAARQRYANDPVNRAEKLRRARARNARRRSIDVADLLARDGILCQYCGLELGDPFDGRQTHVDHARPLARGGFDVLANKQLMHARCNLRKGARE